MVAPTYRFSPFDQRQSSESAGRKAPGRSPAAPDDGYPAGRTSFAEIVCHAGGDAPGEPSDLSAPGRYPHSHGEQHDDATSQAASSTVGGRLVPDADARRMASAVPVAADIERLATRLRRGAQDARRIADNAEILSRRLQRELPYPSAGLAYAANEHAELSDTLADAHALVVRCAAHPDLPLILAALERGEQVAFVRAHDPSVLFSASDNLPARAGVVGDDVNPTSLPRKLWSVFLNFVLPGHRKPSSPAHQSAPASFRDPFNTEATDACSNSVCETINRKVV